MEIAQEIVLNALTSSMAIGVYGTILAMGVVSAGKKYLDRQKRQKAFEIALMVADEVEDATVEETRVDNFLDKFIEYMENEVGRPPKEYEIKQAEQVKKKVDMGN